MPPSRVAQSLADWNAEPLDRWFDASVFLAGDFNGDGKCDMAQMWDDISEGSPVLDLVHHNNFGCGHDWTTSVNHRPRRYRRKSL
jgi:hypothetical protein